ncbi:MAG TPA: glutamyl-tRNA reductase [Actinomycetota bacterium]|jgi:glutamyl-tRNA reductase|nr:glutamyl-tRNA reductase [Actinomycetota bacterium]
MAIVVCGLSHKTVPLPVLEQLAVTPDALPKALAQLMDQETLHEGVILSTCNRTEVYATVHRFHPAVQAARRFLSDVSGVSQDRISDGLYTYYDTDAVRHLFNVASGTDSMVVGEPEILGQVREAFRVATEEGTARRMLGALFQRALRVGKRSRSETAISRHVVSLPQAAARVAAELSNGLEGKSVVVVGAGRIGELAARAAREGGSAEVVIANRSVERARNLADNLGARSAGLDELPALLTTADVVITVTSSADPVIDRSMLERATEGRTLVAVDVAMPRDIEPAARDLAGVVLRDIDDLRGVVEQGAELRRAELPKVDAIVSEEVEEFCAWERSLALGPAITELRDWAERIRSEEVAKLAQKQNLTEDERAAVDRLTRGIVNKLLHRPMTQIRELVRSSDGQVFLEAFQEIFGTDQDAP